MRTRRTRTALALAAAALVMLAGCGDDPDGDPAPAPTAGEPATATDDPSTEPTSDEPDESDEPEVAPATGPVLEQDIVTLRLPEGWKPEDGIGDLVSGYSRGGDVLRLIAREWSGRPQVGNTFLAGVQRDNRTFAGATVERLDDRPLDGVAAYHLTGRTDGPGRGDVFHDLGVVHEGRFVTLSFELDPRTLRRDPDLVESVLATVELDD